MPTHRTSRQPTREKRTRRYKPNHKNISRQIWCKNGPFFLFWEHKHWRIPVYIYFYLTQNESWTPSSQVSGFITSALHLDSASCENLRLSQRSVLLHLPELHISCLSHTETSSQGGTFKKYYQPLWRNINILCDIKSDLVLCSRWKCAAGQ